MTLKHKIALIVPKTRWLVDYLLKIKRQWLRLKTVVELNKLRDFLVDKKLEYGRKNTEESQKYEFAVEKQIELLDRILDKHDGI